MNLCMMSCAMGGDPRKIAETAVRCGMSGIDWTHTGKDSAKGLKKIADDAGLRIVSFTTLDTRITSCGPERMEAFLDFLEQTVSLGAPEMMVPPFSAVGAATREDALLRWIDFYSEIQILAAEEGIFVSFETTPAAGAGSPVFSPQEALRILQSVPGMKMVFDQGNISLASDPAEACGLLRDFIVRFHLKDFEIGTGPGPGFRESVNGHWYRFARMGCGSLDLPGFWKRVPESLRSCYVTPETNDPAGIIPIQDVMLSASDWMRSWKEE